MPVSLADLASDIAHVTVTYNGHTLDVEYAPSLVTEKALSDILAVSSQRETIAKLPPAIASKRKRGTVAASPLTNPQAASHFAELLDFTGALNGLIARLVKAWDLTENDHVTMFPLTEIVIDKDTPAPGRVVPSSRLAELPLGFRRAVIEAIFGDLRMDPEKGMR